ncbi:MAG: hypothetical protein JRG97_13045 [Deltaproteobacteria bacterium]|nr:hypothetical protein [Deltaproteobacteria bacterium]
MPIGQRRLTVWYPDTDAVYTRAARFVRYRIDLNLQQIRAAEQVFGAFCRLSAFSGRMAGIPYRGGFSIWKRYMNVVPWQQGSAHKILRIRAFVINKFRLALGWEKI